MGEVVLATVTITAQTGHLQLYTLLSLGDLVFFYRRVSLFFFYSGRYTTSEVCLSLVSFVTWGVSSFGIFVGASFPLVILSTFFLFWVELFQLYFYSCCGVSWSLLPAWDAGVLVRGLISRIFTAVPGGPRRCLSVRCFPGFLLPLSPSGCSVPRVTGACLCLFLPRRCIRAFLTPSSLRFLGCGLSDCLIFLKRSWAERLGVCRLCVLRRLASSLSTYRLWVVRISRVSSLFLTVRPRVNGCVIWLFLCHPLRLFLCLLDASSVPFTYGLWGFLLCFFCLSFRLREV